MKTYDVDPQRGKRLKDRREELKLSQQELANQIRSGRPSIARWEKGAVISNDSLQALSEALRKDKEWFLYGDKGPSLPQATVAAISASTSLAVKILLAYDIDIRSDVAQRFISAVIRQASETGPLSETAIREWIAALVGKQPSE